jgi:galactokinase
MDIRQYFAQKFHTTPALVARAPGRLEFIGNHLDYNGGPVIGAAIDRYVTAAISPRDDAKILLASDARETIAEVALADIAPLTGDAMWANYVLGVFKVLRDAGLRAERGFNIALVSDLPIGAGLSSSAAIELAAAYAIARLHNFPLDPRSAAIHGRAAENTFVGMPCGILDQGTSAFGKAGSLVLIDCAENTFSTCPMPGGARFWVFNTRKKHALIDGLYAERNRECREAFAMLAAATPGLRNLASATREQVAAAEAALGVARHKRALHVVDETGRVHATLAALKTGDLAAVGRALNASHNSSRLLFENSCDELDHLAAHLAKTPGVYGARLTGGGFGGAVMALTDESFDSRSAEQVAAAYAEKFGDSPSVFHAITGDGATLL